MKEGEKKETLLSVCIITYNHASCIVQAIEGVLMQAVNFSFDIIIADDCSTDGSREILLDYQKKYPHKIRLILQEKNVGIHKNWVDLLQYPQSKYIAWLDGDDYWTDRTKLQRQIDILENDATVSACGHNVNVLYVNDNKELPSESNVSSIKRLTLAETGSGMPCHSSSLVFRNTPVYAIPWLLRIPIGDWPHLSLTMISGDLVLLPETMAVYRQNIGVWSSMTRGRQIKGIVEAINAMIAAPEFLARSEFRKNLTKTKIAYLKELYAAEDNKVYVVNQDEISIVDYYEDVVTRLQTAFKNKDELAARVPVSTLVKALFTKFNRKISK